MTAFNAARETDPVGHEGAVTGIVSVPIGPCGLPPVLIAGLSAAHVYCTAPCSGTCFAGIVHPPAPKPPILVNGAATVLIHGVPANRIFPSGDVSDCGAQVAPPGSGSVLIGGPGEDSGSAKCLARPLMRTEGHGTIADCDLVAAELGKLPPHIVKRFRDKGIKIVACRGSVTDYKTALKGVRPRGWPEGTTWDNVTGVGGGDECVIAVVGHGTPVGAHVPAKGEGHGSSNVVIHESFHALDDSTGNPSAKDEAFNRAREADAQTLSRYESQAGEAGREETYAESAARYYGGDESDAKDHPKLHSYWGSDPLKGTP